MSNHRFSPVSEDEPCCNLSQKAKICLGTFCVLVVLTIAVMVGVLWGLPAPKLKEWDGKGTTPNFPEIVLGRCYTYTKVLRPELSHKDCRKIGKAFMDAFLSKDPCSSTERDYQPLLELTNQTVPCNKTLFWSKSSELAHQYTTVQQEMFTLENTLLGYIADGLNWCGDADSSEVNYGSCPTRGGKCINNTFSVFWNTVSKRFAENACGVVQVVLNGSISNTFNKNSTFGRVEIYNLRPEKVPTLQAWVMHDIGDRSVACSSSSINDLKLILSNRNIKFTCHDNYRPIKFLQCVKNPEHSSCRSLI
ncbi:CD38 molecule [Rhinolophus ferrumequinum]|uniref:ADP-ribosyl cyclase/cyclic ADP-ribose hydrolase 1 n=1 Tax=Rhinolophus ferrumequinum TaxID=59479 RepID=A0A7J7ZBH9_RHIFE|nr:CD38 molecule [Rhinolophus ferrumequinum]